MMHLFFSREHKKRSQGTRPNSFRIKNPTKDPFKETFDDQFNDSIYSYLD